MAEDSFPFQQIRKIHRTLEPPPEPEPVEPVEPVDLDQQVERESRESMMRRAEAALQAVADLVARHPDVADLVRALREERAAAEAAPAEEEAAD